MLSCEVSAALEGEDAEAELFSSWLLELRMPSRVAHKKIGRQDLVWFSAFVGTDLRTANASVPVPENHNSGFQAASRHAACLRYTRRDKPCLRRNEKSPSSKQPNRSPSQSPPPVRRHHAALQR